MIATQPLLAPPTICQVLHSLHIGGAEVLAAGIARELRSRFRFVFACLDGAGPLAEQLRDEGHVVEVLNRQPGVDWSCGRRLARFLREQNVSAIHAHQYTPFFYSLLARGLRSDPPVIFTEHGRQHPDSRKLKRVVCNRLLLRPRDRVIAVGEAVRQAVIANEGIPASRVDVLFNGVCLDQFQDAAADPAVRAAVRRELGLADDTFVIVQVARLNELKDHVTAARAIASASQRGPNIRWLVVGDGEQRAMLEATIRKLKIGHVTTLLGTRRDIPRLLAASDACLLSSLSEGIPLTLIEAMAARLPVVATDVGGVAEVVVPEVTGLLAPVRDSGALADHLVRLARDHSLATRLGRNGAARAADLFSFEQMVHGYGRVFDEACRLVASREVRLPRLPRHQLTHPDMTRT
jgi:glycosyltransferase involved in cell wall biosynthesis